MFQGAQPPVPADGSGITSGLVETAQVMEKVNEQIDNAEDFKGIMDALRGDDSSVEDRRSELADYVGNEDAEKTPESVLTLLQPTFSILEMAEQESPEGGINMGAMQAPRPQEAMARMAMGEQPVMRQGGTPQTEAGGETVPPTVNLSNLQAIQGLVPKATSYEQYLQKYQGMLGDSNTGLEMNPYISLLNLAGAVANAPQGQLLSSVLDPSTIKNVSDPILQMAQAKAKTEQAIKLKAADAAAASASAEQKSKSDILSKAIPELLKAPDLKTFGNETLGYFAVDPRDPTKVITLQVGLGREKNIFGNTEMGYGYLNDKNKYVSVKEGLGRKPDIFGSAEGGYYYLGDNNQIMTAKDGTGAKGQIYGNTELGYYSYDPTTKSTTLLTAGTGKEQPEFVQLIERFNDISAKVAAGGLSTDELAKANQELKFLSGKLTPDPKGTEFERLLAQGKQQVFDTTEGTTAEKETAANEFEANALQGYIKAKTTPDLKFDPRGDINKVFAGLTEKLVTSVDEGAQRATQLSELGTIAEAASQEFRTGALAEQRLGILKLARTLGIEESLKNALGDNYEGIMSGSIVAGDLLDSAGSQFAVLMAGNFPGNLNQSEVDLIKAAGPSLFKSGEAIASLNTMFTRAAARAQEELKITQDYLSKEENKSQDAQAQYVGLNKALNEYRKANPVITEDLVNSMIGGTDASGDVTEVPEGGARMVIRGGDETTVMNASQLDLWRSVTTANDFDDFLTNVYPTLVQQGKMDADLTSQQLRPFYDQYSSLEIMGAN